MRTLVKCLNISIWLFFLMGAVSAFVFSTWTLIPVLAICLGMGFISQSIERQSRTGAVIGIVVMSLLTFSILFPLGLTGLISAYRGKDEWTNW